MTLNLNRVAPLVADPPDATPPLVLPPFIAVAFELIMGFKNRLWLHVCHSTGILNMNLS